MIPPNPPTKVFLLMMKFNYQFLLRWRPELAKGATETGGHLQVEASGDKLLQGEVSSFNLWVISGLLQISPVN